jgi:glycosyltransferase involved in cell wall biosynthesis
MKVAIRQVRGSSGSDIWADNLCRGLNNSGQDCSVDLYSIAYQVVPSLARLFPTPPPSDIVHGNSWNGFAFKNKVPLVVTEHHVVHDPVYSAYRTFPQNAFHRLIYRCERRSFEVADAVTCVSQFTRKKLEESFGIMDSQVIYNGIDTNVFKPIKSNTREWSIPQEKAILFFAGNLSRRKGADLLPAIMKQLGENYILLIATNTRVSYFDNIKNIINIGHLDLSRLVAAYNQCDIFLSASRLEGFGLSVAEAMACGKPVVATNGSSLPELVIDEKGGFLCKIDDVKDFADRIGQIAVDEELKRRMGLFNRRRVEEMFTLEKMVEGYISVYHRLL